MALTSIQIVMLKWLLMVLKGWGKARYPKNPFERLKRTILLVQSDA